MQNTINITEDLVYVGGSDRRLALFENAYPIPRGVSYNSYLLLDEKTVLFDTADLAVSEQFLENVQFALGSRKLDYLVVHHMEPDHSASFLRIIKTYPEVTVVTNQKVAQMLSNFFPFERSGMQIVKEGDVLEAGRHKLQFVFAPMVHWPEVMFSFDTTTGTLFSADAFGTWGALGGSIFADEVHFERDFLNDARRYYFNIVGKYGAQVQNALKKASALDIKMICPLHGPIWRKDLGWYIGKYAAWSAYTPEERGVAVFYASIYGHTANAAEILASAVAQAGAPNVKVYDVSQTDVSELLAEAFRFSHVVFASATYNNGIFINMENFIHDLKAHNFQNRKFAVIENGSWSPQAGALIQAAVSEWKGMKQIGDKITVVSSVKEETARALRALGKQIADDVNAE